MSDTIKIDIDGLDETLASVLRVISPSQRMVAFKVGARAAQQSLKKYHREAGRSLWINPSLPTHGAGRRQSNWWRQVQAGWMVAAVTDKTAEIRNGATFFAHKVRGGTIRAKRVKFLTIPLVPEAHGETARTYEQKKGRKLFTIPGRNALFEKVGKGGTESAVSAFRGSYRPGRRAIVGRRANVKKGQQIRPVFALKQSVTQKPWPGALPPEEVYVGPFAIAAINKLLES